MARVPTEDTWGLKCAGTLQVEPTLPDLTDDRAFHAAGRGAWGPGNNKTLPLVHG